MTFEIEVFEEARYAEEAHRHIARHLPAQGSVFLTGGTTAEKLYPLLARSGHDWSRVEVGFSDERCVPPDHDASNYRLASDLLLNEVGPRTIHRMKGEDDPEAAAHTYDRAIRPLVAKRIDLLLLGMGADAHVGAMFPQSPALGEKELLCRAVDRPDGMQGLTLTPPAMLGAREILLLVTGEAKAEAVQRVLQGRERAATCPARVLAQHGHATFLLDRPAASAL